jgi:RNA polymerase sigma-70 factor (ECF subfamily)
VSVDWGEVYTASYGQLVRFLHRQVWDEERAHDLAQEAFTRSLGHDPENPRAWVFRVATNLARDEARMIVRRKRHLALLRTDAEDASVVTSTPADQMEEEESAERVRRALDGLSDRDREVLLLWDAGLNYTDIAAQTGLAPGAIGTTLARARKRLVESYDAQEEKNVARG